MKRAVCCTAVLILFLLTGCEKSDEVRAKEKARQAGRELKQDLKQAEQEVKQGLHKAKKELER